MTRAGRVKRGLAVLAIAVSTVGCDRLTKVAARDQLSGKGRTSLIADVLRLEYAENAGGFLSLGAALPSVSRVAVFTVGTALGLTVVGLALARRLQRAEPVLGLALLWSGGVSNLADRVAGGTVVDFLNLGIGPVRTGIFNVADVAIMLGIAALIVEARKARRPRAATAAGPVNGQEVR